MGLAPPVGLHARRRAAVRAGSRRAGAGHCPSSCCSAPASPALSAQPGSSERQPERAHRLFHPALHTDEEDARSLRLLTEPGAQGERPLPDPRDTDEQPFPVYQLVPDSQRAWHAGRSRWHHYAGLQAPVRSASR